MSALYLAVNRSERTGLDPGAVLSAAAGTLLAASLLFLYWDVTAALVRQWSASPMYSYGFFIPITTAYLVFLRREELSRVNPAPAYLLGSLFLVPSIILFLVGHAGSVLIIQELTLPITLMGCVAFLCGGRWLAMLFLPLCYLFFMVPFWEVFTDPLHWHLQIFSAKMGVWLLDLLKVPSYLKGIYIHLPNVTLEIAAVCSGVNYLIAIVALGVPLAIIHLDSRVKRTLLVLSAVGIAIAANGFRIAFIGLWSYSGRATDVHGPFHVFQGLFVSMVGYIVLFLGLGILSRRPSRRDRIEIP